MIIVSPLHERRRFKEIILTSFLSGEPARVGPVGKKRGRESFFGSMFVLEGRHARLASLAVRGTRCSFPIGVHLC